MATTQQAKAALDELYGALADSSGFAPNETALQEKLKLVQQHIDELQDIIDRASEALFNTHDDCEHQITCHADTLPDAYRLMSKSAMLARDELNKAYKDVG